MTRARPVEGFVLLVDDPPEYVDGGVVVRMKSTGPDAHLDYVVAMCAENPDYGPGDRVVIRSPGAGRSVFLDRIAHRLVAEGDVIAVVGRPAD